MRTVEINIYKMNELSEEIQEKIVNDFRINNDLPFFSEILNSMQAIAKHLEVQITNYEFSDNINFVDSTSLSNEEEIEKFSIHRTYRYIVNHYSSILKQNKVYEKNGKKRVSKIIKEDSCCPFTGVCFDEDFLDVIRKYLNVPDYRTVNDIIKETLNCAIKMFRTECVDYFSKENILGVSEANNWEYTEDGKFYSA